MRRITAHRPPKEFAELRAAREEYDQFSSERAIRRVLWEQQGGRCAYCERRLRHWDRDDHQTRIEHFHPQNGNVWSSVCKLRSGAATQTKASTTWKNFLLCCNGEEPLDKSFHRCDVTKYNTDICETFRNPRDWDGDRLVDIKRSGKAVARPGMPAGAQDVLDSVVRVNAPELVEVRKRVLGDLEIVVRAFWNGSAAQRALVASRLREQAETVEYATTYLTLAARFEPST
ncbi:hypothetical protein [Curtobacterium sp. VKM Ac-1395]|uniref:hypothetical protein n=1 Tax=Curtobacterium sp. VKM Ac-1395 TaxID=2783815 RepID=UPI00188DA447|nr:hypothetical protein [Curtobacterium sp. VKM Ac-1395]MBF4590697.1 hypothetical protein [Curtobacterium sp. VKM Ac-1395]